METHGARVSSLEKPPLSTPAVVTGHGTTVTGAVSLTAHALALATVLTLPLFLDRSLPEPAHGTRAFLAEPIQLAPPPPPPPASAHSAPARDARPALASDALVAPAQVPLELAPESGLDLGLEGGVPGGIEGGVPGGVVGGIVGGLPDAPAPPRRQPLVVGGEIQAPRRLRGDPPVYPAVARRARLQGMVILECVIDERGRVRDAKVLRGVPLLDEAALDAVRGWVYAPTLFDGVPVPVQMTVTVTFQLAAPSPRASGLARRPGACARLRGRPDPWQSSSLRHLRFLMVFSSTIFLFVFLPIVLGAYGLLSLLLRRAGGRSALSTIRNGFLLLASLVFYAWGEPFLHLRRLRDVPGTVRRRGRLRPVDPLVERPAARGTARAPARGRRRLACRLGRPGDRRRGRGTRRPADPEPGEGAGRHLQPVHLLPLLSFLAATERRSL